jgi:hypothetical protein
VVCGRYSTLLVGTIELVKGCVKFWELKDKAKLFAIIIPAFSHLDHRTDSKYVFCLLLCLHSKQRLNELQMKSYGNYTEMMEEIKKMIKFREVTIELMRSVADELERIHRPANKVKLVSAVGVVGGIVAVVAGIALSPFTAGTSVLAGAAASVAITGGVVAAGTGAATHIGTQAVEKILERLDLAKVQSAVDKDKEQCEKVGRLWKELKLSNGFVHETKTIIDREAAIPMFVNARLLIDVRSLLQIAVRDVLHDIPSEAVKILRWKSLLLNVEYNNWKRIIDV